MKSNKLKQTLKKSEWSKNNF